MCHVRGNQQEAAAVSLLSWSPLEGEEDYSVEMASAENSGVDSMGSDATLQNVGEIRARQSP